MTTNTFPRCTICQGNAGRLNADGVHNLCAARRTRALPTPNLGERCQACKGAGTQGRGGVPLFLDHGPSIVARSITAQFPPGPPCGGKGYTEV